MKHVLVTGGNGFIGRAVVDRLLALDIETYVYALPQDIRDAREVSKAVAGCDAVIHLAGVLGTHELFDTPELAIDVNIKGTLNVLDACVEHSAGYVGITMPQVFPSIYTATKIAATRLASAYHHTYELPVSHVRAFNAFGPGQAHGPGHPQKIIPTFATCAWHGKEIPIWGSGLQTVDLISSTDLAKLLVAALRFHDDRTIDGGSGHAIPVIDVARKVCEIVGVTPLIRYLPMRRGEVPTNIQAERGGWGLLNMDEIPRSYPDITETVMSYKS